MATDYKKIRNKLEKMQDTKRFEHTLGVAYTASMLASIHGADENDAFLAGLLHDCAKCMDTEEKIKICEKNKMKITDIELRNPFLLHAKAGRCVAKKKFDIDNEDILNAIEYHTTGRPDMSVLEKIIFIADYIEPCRKQAKNLPYLRKIAFTDLDQALIEVLANTLDYLHSKENEIDPMTQNTYDFYCKNEVK